jgi:8-oxo-dGTP pyrophosphatase MutT (NUDIX family)
MGRPGDPDATARITAIRETLEETGLLLGLDRQISAAAAAKARQALHAGATLGQVLQANAWRLDLALLTPFAHWRQPRVGGFDTRFYLADLGSGAVDLAADGSESTRLAWICAADALAQEAAGGLKVIFPTRRNLERLARFASHAEACADARAHPIVPIVSQVENRAGADWLVIPEGLGYPVTGEPLELARRG